LIAFGCAADDGDDERSDRLFTGFADGDIALAGVREDDILTMYVCGGEQTYATHTMWFHALPIVDGIIDGQTATASVHGELDDAGELTGTLRGPDGMDRQWSLSPTTQSSLAGLYTAVTDGCTTGVIVWESGTDQSTDEPTYDAQGTWCNSASEFEQVIILEPLTFTSAGLQVSVEREGFESFVVEPF
jgi:hypothetical protein